MRIKRTAEWLAIACMALVWAVPSARGQSYGTELPFVLGADARSSGLGAAAITLADDPSIQNRNPAGLACLQWKELLLYRTGLYDSKSVYYALSYAHPLIEHGTLAISILRVDVGGIEERDSQNRLLSADLHNAQTRVLLGYAATITSSIAAGFNLKIDNQSFGGFSASGVGLDAGFMATQRFSGGSFLRGLREGISIQNLLEPGLKLDSEDVSDPMNILFGVSAVTGFGNVSLVTTLDLASPRYSPVDVRFGQEVEYDGHFALRFGVDDVTPTYGFGARYRQLALDYAYRDGDLGDNHRISLAVRFGASVPERRAEARARLEAEVGSMLSARVADVERAHVDRSMLEADSAFASGETELAAALYERVLLWDPENAAAERKLSDSRYRQAVSQAASATAKENWVEGLFFSNRALSYAPDDSAASSLAALCGEKMKAAQNDQALFASLLKSSIDLYAERRFAEALAGFEEAHRISPSARLAAEYADKCRAAIGESVRRARADAAARAGRGDYDGAVLALESVRDYSSFDPAIAKEIERYKIERRESARSAADDAPRAAPEPAPAGAEDKTLERNYRSGIAAFNAGRFDRAAEYFLKVWTARPDYQNTAELLTKAYLFVGMGFYSDGNYSEAIDAWRKALTIDPENSKAKRYLGKANEELEKLDGVSYGR